MSNPNSELSPEERGLPPADPKPVDPQGQPRGNAVYPVGHVSTFAGVTNWANRSYSYMYDEAMRHSRENAERMRLDPVIDACLRLRTYPTALLTVHIDPDDDEDEYQVECAMKAQKLLTNLPGFLFAKRWLLDDGIFKGRSAVQMRWQWVHKRGRNWHLPTGWRMVDGDKLVFGWDERVGILVSSAVAPPTDRLGTSERGRVYYCTPEEREQLAVHEFEPEDKSFYQNQMAGAIHGTGMRGRLYWLWALKVRVWEMGMDFLQWFARGLMVYYFQSGNEEHYNQIKSFVENQDGSGSLFMPWLPGPAQAGYKPIERFEASTASPAFIQQLITQYFDDLFKLNILGQTLTSGTASTGLGSGVAQAHQSTFENFVKYDAIALGETFTRDILRPFYRVNFPGVPPARWVFEVDDPNVQQMIENAQVLYSMGAAIPEETLLEAAGLPQPKTGQTILTDIQPMQPAAVGGMPNGVPTTSPMQLSLRQWATLTTAARNGDRRAAKILLSRKYAVKGLNR